MAHCLKFISGKNMSLALPFNPDIIRPYLFVYLVKTFPKYVFGISSRVLRLLHPAFVREQQQTSVQYLDQHELH